MQTAGAMTAKVSVIFLIVQMWISLQFVNATDPFRGLHGAPIIDPFDSFLILGVNSDKLIECKGESPVSWISEVLSSQNGNANIVNSVEDDSDKTIYRSNLELQSVTTEFVGRYYCVFNNSLKDESPINYDQEVESYKASSIYIFVDDPENLLVENFDHNMIIGRQYEPFIIPCKPTSPKVKVELIREDGEEQVIGSYDPAVGFTVSFSHVEESGYYDCRIRDTEDLIQFHVIVNENCESKENCSNEAMFSINQTIDVSTTTTSISPELLQLELLDRLENLLSGGDGLINRKSKALTSYLPPPTISSDSMFFATEGNDFQLTCHIEVHTNIIYTAAFTHNGVVLKTNDFITVSELLHDTSNRQKASLNLTVRQSVEDRDSGDYKCTVMDYYNNTNSAFATINFVSEPQIDLKPTNPRIDIDKGKKQAQFLIEYTAYPSATFYIYNPRREQISSDMDVMDRTKYDVIIEHQKNQLKLKIKYPDINDFGNYTLVATTLGRNFTTEVRLVVSEKPTVSMEDVYVMAGEEVHMICQVLAYPPAQISFSFSPCQDLSLWPTCRKARIQNQSDHDETLDSKQSSENTQTSEIIFRATEPGSVRCSAKNSAGSHHALGQVKIGDMSKPFMISGLKDDQRIADGDFLRLECGAIIYNYTNNIVWRKNGEIIESLDNLVVEETNTKFSWRKTLTWKQITKNDEGDYECEVSARDAHEPPETLPISIAVHEAQPPVITSNFDPNGMTLSMGDSLKLDCLVSGLPTPQLLWFKNDEPFVIDDNNSQRITIDDINSSITFSLLKLEDAGTYKCVASNRVGEDFKTVELRIPTPVGNLSLGIIFGIASIIFILICISIYLCIRVRRKTRLIAEMKAAGLANFEEGNLESLDPDVNLDEQADLLPYNKDVEFPRDKLKLGKQLGAGAFGVVVKAIAQGIVPYEEESTVAVKMVKKQTDNDVMKALVSELKIMIHLGQHLNVVNLLGAVTKNITKRELMVIVEYCQFGNLQSFLVKHRPYFIDQIRNDKIDTMIMKNDLRWSKNSAFNTYNSDGNPYTVGPSPVGAVNPGAHLNSQGYVRHSGFQNTQNTQIDSCNTELSTLSNGQEDSAMLSNNSEQPLWRSNYGMDYKGPARSVCTSDLVCWSFQVARGMDYLSSRKVLHGDLAARNILLAEDNIVKICDFGLARSMYKNDNYKKKGEAPLPFKWLALESISDHTFSTYSDVWAFGVVLWELFSLGKVPYTGMEANQNLYYKLRDGYRMEKPAFANQDIYDIMLNCWNAKPESRPLFNQLEKRLGSFIHESVKEHYVDLNEPYMTANITNYETGRPDYLTQLSCPVSEAPMPPLAEEENFYVNNSVEMQKSPSAQDYLSMSPKSGTVRYNSNLAPHKSDYIRPDSPTIAKNLDSSPKNKSKHPNKKPALPEEIPMLKRNENGVDSDEEQNGYTEMSFSNGNQAKPITSDAEVFNPSDNYVNVPSAKSIANPSYITFNTVNERLN